MVISAVGGTSTMTTEGATSVGLWLVAGVESSESD